MSIPPLSVQVEPRYLPEDSSPDNGVFTFAYTITVTNVAKMAVQLISRHWIFADDSGHTQEVNGLGVVGKQPLLAPGESFTYTSGCRLHAASGSMHGSYFAVSENGERFYIPIALVALEADGGDTPVSRVLH